MTNISCDVVKCVFNTQGGCSRDKICIDNNCQAHECCETFCNSFSDKMSEMKNCACTNGCPCEKAEIKCDVTNCVHNSNAICTAERINVGTAQAKCSHETECDTFAEKQ